MNGHGTGLAALVISFSLFFPSIIDLAQERPSGFDAELSAIMDADNEGRLADADRLLASAMQKAKEYSDTRRQSLLLNHLASLRLHQGRTGEAIAASKQQIALDERLFGPGSGRVAADYSNLGMMYRSAGDNEAAEEALRRGLALARLSPGARQRALPLLLNNLAAFYMQTHREAEAQALIEEGLATCDQEHPGQGPASCAQFRGLLASNLRTTAHENAAEGIIADSIAGEHDSEPAWYAMVMDLDTLARQYEQDASFDLAEQAYREAIEIIRRRSKPDQPFWPNEQLNALGEVLVKEGRNAEAEDCFKQAMAMQEQAASSERRSFARSISYFGLLNLYREQNRLAEMEPLLLHWLAVQERILGSTDASLADTLLGLADIRAELQEYPGAEQLYQRALSIQERNLGPDDPHVASTLQAYARILRKEGKTEAAQVAENRARAPERK